MEFKNNLDFLAPNDIRIRGTRIGIETILQEFLHEGRTPEDIVERHRGLALSQVYATVAYYVENEDAAQAYLSNWLDQSHKVREQQDRSPPLGVARLRAIKHGGSNGAVGHE